MRHKLMRGIGLLAVAAGGAALLTQTLRAQEKPLNVVPEVDFERYAGKWYEIARLPFRYQEDCARDVTAIYTPRPDGRITVVNRCVEKDGKINDAEGVARRVDGKPPSVLKVRFAPGWHEAFRITLLRLGADHPHHRGRGRRGNGLVQAAKVGRGREVPDPLRHRAQGTDRRGRTRSPSRSRPSTCLSPWGKPRGADTWRGRQRE